MIDVGFKMRDRHDRGGKEVGVEVVRHVDVVKGSERLVRLNEVPEEPRDAFGSGKRSPGHLEGGVSLGADVALRPRKRVEHHWTCKVGRRRLSRLGRRTRICLKRDIGPEWKSCCLAW